MSISEKHLQVLMKRASMGNQTQQTLMQAANMAKPPGAPPMPTFPEPEQPKGDDGTAMAQLQFKMEEAKRKIAEKNEKEKMTLRGEVERLKQEVDNQKAQRALERQHLANMEKLRAREDALKAQEGELEHKKVLDASEIAEQKAEARAEIAQQRADAIASVAEQQAQRYVKTTEDAKKSVDKYHADSMKAINKQHADNMAALDKQKAALEASKPGLSPLVQSSMDRMQKRIQNMHKVRTKLQAMQGVSMTDAHAEDDPVYDFGKKASKDATLEKSDTVAKSNIRNQALGNNPSAPKAKDPRAAYGPSAEAQVRQARSWLANNQWQYSQRMNKNMTAADRKMLHSEMQRGLNILSEEQANRGIGGGLKTTTGKGNKNAYKTPSAGGVRGHEGLGGIQNEYLKSLQTAAGGYTGQVFDNFNEHVAKLKAKKNTDASARLQLARLGDITAQEYDKHLGQRISIADKIALTENMTRSKRYNNYTDKLKGGAGWANWVFDPNTRRFSIENSQMDDDGKLSMGFGSQFYRGFMGAANPQDSGVGATLGSVLGFINPATWAGGVSEATFDAIENQRIRNATARRYGVDQPWFTSDPNDKKYGHYNQALAAKGIDGSVWGGVKDWGNVAGQGAMTIGSAMSLGGAGAAVRGTMALTKGLPWWQRGLRTAWTATHAPITAGAKGMGKVFGAGMALQAPTMISQFTTPQGPDPYRGAYWQSNADPYTIEKMRSEDRKSYNELMQQMTKASSFDANAYAHDKYDAAHGYTTSASDGLISTILGSIPGIGSIVKHPLVQSGLDMTEKFVGPIGTGLLQRMGVPVMNTAGVTTTVPRNPESYGNLQRALTGWLHPSAFKNLDVESTGLTPAGMLLNERAKASKGEPITSRGTNAATRGWFRDI